jgi:cytochrome c oxidase subunit 2
VKKILVLSLALALPGVIGADAVPRTVEITAKRFEFVPSTITLRKGETVRLHVTSADVTHGLFLRPLKIDAELVPGVSEDVIVTPQQAGTFTAICHHFCGAGHGNMKLTVIVE